MSPETAPARPVSPNELTNFQREQMPVEVIETFNEMLAENVIEGYGTVKQKEVIDRLVTKGLERALIFQRGWLNVEEIYREAGWKVEYDKPGYNESYDAYFKFTAKRECH